MIRKHKTPIDDPPPESPTLTVDQGYVRFHLLQGNSNNGPGGKNFNPDTGEGDRDANGTDIVLLELWKVDEPPTGFFRLLYGRSPVHTFAKTQNTPVLHEIDPENEILEVNLKGNELAVSPPFKFHMTAEHVFDFGKAGALMPWVTYHWEDESYLTV